MAKKSRNLAIRPKCFYGNMKRIILETKPKRLNRQKQIATKHRNIILFFTKNWPQVGRVKQGPVSNFHLVNRSGQEPSKYVDELTR